jgi:hypothetical protein
LRWDEPLQNVASFGMESASFEPGALKTDLECGRIPESRARALSLRVGPNRIALLLAVHSDAADSTVGIISNLRSNRLPRLAACA